jgi:hypothetical protein
MTRCTTILLAAFALSGCFEDTGPVEGEVPQSTETDPWDTEGTDLGESSEDPDQTDDDGLTSGPDATDDTSDDLTSEPSGETSGPDTGTDDATTAPDETTTGTSAPATATDDPTIPTTPTDDTTSADPAFYTPCVNDADCGAGQFCTPHSGTRGHCTERCDCATSDVLSCGSNTCPLPQTGSLSPWCYGPYEDGNAKGGHCWLFTPGSCHVGIECPDGLVCVDFVGGEADGKAFCRAP